MAVIKNSRKLVDKRNIMSKDNDKMELEINNSFFNKNFKINFVIQI